MEYAEAVADLLGAINDQDLEGIRDCSEVLWNLANTLFPVTDREANYASLLLEELEKVAF